MKKSIRIMCAVFAVLMMASCFTVSTSAYSYTESGNGTRTINPTNSNMNSAKSPVYFATKEQISDSVSAARSVDIFHYEAPKGGYYMIYTTGSTDTYAKLYEENSTLWWNVHYDQIAADDDSGSGTNFKIVMNLDKYEDYFIAVRGYSTRTGDYELNIAPNLDEMSSTTGGKWVNDNPAKSAVYSKTYMNEEQVKEYYRMLRDQQTRSIIKNAYTRYGAVGACQHLLNIGATCFTIVGLVFPPSGVVAALVDIGVGALETLFDSFYEDIESVTTIMYQLEKICGCGYTKCDGYDLYNNPTAGVLITTDKNWVGNLKNTYSSFTGTKLTGKDYYSGSWS